MRPSPFETFKLIYPPRAKAVINPATLSQYSGFIAQYKYNDIRTLIYFFPDSHVEMFTRHREPHRFYRLTGGMKRSLSRLDLPRGSFHVIDGGVLREQVLGEYPIVIWDVLVHRGVYLLGTTYRERYRLLAGVAGHPTEAEPYTRHALGLRIDGFLWLAQTFEKEDFRARYEKMIRLDVIEGLMLKDPNGTLEPGYRELNNTRWMIKARKPHPNYPY